MPSSAASLNCVFSCGRRASLVVGRLEGDAAEHYRGDRLRAQPEPARIDLHIEAACMPEAGIGADELLVRRVDEDPESDGLAVLVERIRGNLTHPHPPVVHRRADVEGAEVVGPQDELSPGVVTGDDGRHLQPFESARGLCRLAGIGANVGAGEERAQAGDAGRLGPGPHHPEAGVGGGEAARFLEQLDRGDDARAIFRKPHAPYSPDLHLLVLEPCLARLDAFGGAKRNGDGRATLRQHPHHQRGADQCGHDRDQPDQRRQPAAPLHHHRFRRPWSGLSHSMLR